jgi:hypothetical protein
MSAAKRLALIALGYVVAVVGGLGAVALNEMRMPADISQGSPGMVAFGDMVLLVLVTGLLALVPTWFLLKLWIEKAPRTLLVIVLLVAAIGPLSWLTVIYFAGRPSDANLSSLPRAVLQLLGPFIAFGAIPRIVLGPVVVVVEGIVFVLARERAARMLVMAAVLMDLIPLGLFALHMAEATRRYAPPIH